MYRVITAELLPVEGGRIATKILILSGAEKRVRRSDCACEWQYQQHFLSVSLPPPPPSMIRLEKNICSSGTFHHSLFLPWLMVEGELTGV